MNKVFRINKTYLKRQIKLQNLLEFVGTEKEKKWQAQLAHNKKNYYGGVFDNEEDAAMKVNLLCDKFDIERRNPSINIKLNAIQEKNKTSIYAGVSWNNNKKKWEAHSRYNKKKCHGGLFDNEEHAAMKVNLLCDKCGIERKNPTININPNAIQQKNQTSKFYGVCWHKDNKKWRAQLVHKKKIHFGGYFDNEEDAAMKVNLLCDKLEMELKNPSVNTNDNTIQHKTKPIMYQPNPKNIVDEDIKVEHENILDESKDECKNYFMTSNVQQNNVSEKRKRKDKFNCE